MAAEETASNLRSATSGFDALFTNDLDKAREIFKATDSPFHALGAGVCAFLEAALGMEVRFSVISLAPKVINVMSVSHCVVESYGGSNKITLRRRCRRKKTTLCCQVIAVLNAFSRWHGVGARPV